MENEYFSVQSRPFYANKKGWLNIGFFQDSKNAISA